VHHQTVLVKGHHRGVGRRHLLLVATCTTAVYMTTGKGALAAAGRQGTSYIMMHDLPAGSRCEQPLLQERDIRG
jgi:hypothetical protein